jgi:hypothetical protein
MIFRLLSTSFDVVSGFGNNYAGFVDIETYSGISWLIFREGTFDVLRDEILRLIYLFSATGIIESFLAGDILCAMDYNLPLDLNNGLFWNFFREKISFNNALDYIANLG